MTNWLERAKRQIGAIAMGDSPHHSQISDSAGRATAKTDERHLTAVTAVPKPSDSENLRASIGSNGSALAAGLTEIGAATKTALPMTAAEEFAIRAWLAHIEETDEVIIEDLLTKCRANLDARDYFILRAAKNRNDGRSLK